MGGVAPVLASSLLLSLGGGIDPVLFALVAYGILTAVAAFAGHRRILAGKPGGRSLIVMPSLPPLLYLLLLVPTTLFNVDLTSAAIQAVFVFLTTNAFVAWRSPAA